MMDKKIAKWLEGALKRMSDEERWLMESYYMCTYRNEDVSTSAHSDDNVMEIELIDEWSEKIKRYKEISKIEYEHILSCITSQPQVFKSHFINIKNILGL